jgi:hypothetical protein
MGAPPYTTQHLFLDWESLMALTSAELPQLLKLLQTKMSSAFPIELVKNYR